MELYFSTFWFKMRASVGSYQWCQCGEGCHRLLILTTCMCAIHSGVGLMPMVPVRFSLCFHFLFWSLLRFLLVLISGGYLFHSLFYGALSQTCTHIYPSEDAFLLLICMVELLVQPLNTGFYVSVNPCLPEVRKHIMGICQEIVADYEVDGLHLDYIRFPNEYPVLHGHQYPRDQVVLWFYSFPQCIDKYYTTW